MKLNKDINNLGHRERVRNRFLKNKASLYDYEILELLLFYVFKRKDTKPIAKTILKHFKSFKDITSADYEDFFKINGLGKSASILFIIINEIIFRINKEKISESIIVASSNHVIDYYKNIFWNKKYEQLRVMFLNNKNKLLSEELLQKGTFNQTAIYPREIIARALELGASALILVHNHPSGDPTPSRSDVVITKQLNEIACSLDISLLDHLIIGKNKNISLKEIGVI